MALRRPKQQRGAGLVASGIAEDADDLAVFDDPTETDGASAAAPSAPSAPPVKLREDLPRPTGLLGEILVERGAVSKAALEEALKRQKESRERLGTVLLESGVLTQEQLTAALATQYGLKVVAVAKAALDPKVVKVLPEELARELQAVPMSRSGAG